MIQISMFKFHYSTGRKATCRLCDKEFVIDDLAVEIEMSGVVGYLHEACARDFGARLIRLSMGYDYSKGNPPLNTKLTLDVGKE